MNENRIYNVRLSHYNSYSQIYKNLYACAGLNRSNKPEAILKIKYINKIGRFWKSYADDLIQLDLAEKIARKDS